MSVLRPRTVLVPVDFSDASFAAVDTALGMVDSPKQVCVVYVVPDPRNEADFIREAFDAVGARDRAQRELDERLKGKGLEKVRALVAEGSVGQVIAARAEELGADLIVIPSHSRAGLPRLFLGSVANQVLQLADCPVLVLRRS